MKKWVIAKDLMRPGLADVLEPMLGYCNVIAANVDESRAELIASAPELCAAVKALASVVERLDYDLASMGKGRNLSSVPGFEGENIVDACRAILHKIDMGENRDNSIL